MVFSETADFHGRQGLIEFLRQRYLSEHSRAQLFVKPSFYQVFGEALWMEYELRTNTGEKLAVSRGSALWSNTNGEWRIAHLNLDKWRDDPITFSNH